MVFDLILTIDGHQYPVKWVENQTVEELIEQINHGGPIEISMQNYGDKEQVGPLNKIYPSQNKSMSTHPGDIVLYDSNQLVIFYKNHHWDYTFIGHLENMSKNALTEILSQNSIHVTLDIKYD